jgi:hypothetical protein
LNLCHAPARLIDLNSQDPSTLQSACATAPDSHADESAGCAMTGRDSASACGGHMLPVAPGEVAPPTALLSLVSGSQNPFVSPQLTTEAAPAGVDFAFSLPLLI